MTVLLAFLLRNWKPLLGLVMLAIAYGKGRNDANANCDEDKLRAENAILTRDLLVSKEAATYDMQQREELEASIAARDMEIAEYAETLKVEKDCRRTLRSSDLERMRRIDGKSGR
jgi:hypothetical protein